MTREPTGKFTTRDKQLAALVAIHSALHALVEARETDLCLDGIASETDFLLLIDRLLEQVARQVAMIKALDVQIDKLEARKSQARQCAEGVRAVIEQAFLIGALPRLDRPLASLYLRVHPNTLLVEAPTAVPARYWRRGDRVLDEQQLRADLKGRRAALDALIAAPAEGRKAALAAFQERFLSDTEAAALRTRLAGLAAADSPGARAVAIAALRRDFAAIPGAALAGAPPTLTIEWRHPAEPAGRSAYQPQS